jgi:hypothetical protein
MMLIGRRHTWEDMLLHMGIIIAEFRMIALYGEFVEFPMMSNTKR